MFAFLVTGPRLQNALDQRIDDHREMRFVADLLGRSVVKPTMLDKLRELQADYIQQIENEAVRHVEVLQEYLDLVSGLMSYSPLELEAVKRNVSKGI